MADVNRPLQTDSLCMTYGSKGKEKMTCDVCGSHSVQRHTVEGFLVEECQLCGNLQGNDDSVRKILEIREAREQGIPIELYGLVRLIDAIPSLKTDRISIDHDTRTAPQVLFHLTRDSLKEVEKFVMSLSMANRKMRYSWTIELTYQHRLTFVLRPRFFCPPRDVTPPMIEVAWQDVKVLEEQLKRDLKLSWWQGVES